MRSESHRSRATRGKEYTRLQVLLYTLILFAVALLVDHYLAP